MRTHIEQFVFNEFIEAGHPLHIESLCQKLNVTEDEVRRVIPTEWFIPGSNKLISVPIHELVKEIERLSREMSIIHDFIGGKNQAVREFFEKIALRKSGE